MRFKIGDKVKALHTSQCGGFTFGNTYTVRTVYCDRLGVEVDDKGHTNNGWTRQHFELVSDDSPTELQTLVDQANAGFSALRKLRDKYSSETEMKHNNESEYKKIPDYVIDMSYGFTPNVRIKPQTKKFRVASWAAEIMDNTVKIGCKIFYKNDLILAIQQLVKGDHHAFHCYESGAQFQSTRTHFICGEHRITWEQAEQLLKELES